jgi:hypothetical protein
MEWQHCTSGGRNISGKYVALITPLKKKRGPTYEGKNILTPLCKIQIWKMETGRTDYCGHWR